MFWTRTVSQTIIYRHLFSEREGNSFTSSLPWKFEFYILPIIHGNESILNQFLVKWKDLNELHWFQTFSSKYILLFLDCLGLYFPSTVLHFGEKIQTIHWKEIRVYFYKKRILKWAKFNNTVLPLTLSLSLFSTTTTSL